MSNSQRLAAAPHGRQCQDANKIIHAELKGLDFLCGFSGLHTHLSSYRRRATPTRAALTKLLKELIGRHKEGILLKNAADDNHWMCSHDVNDRITAKLPE